MVRAKKILYAKRFQGAPKLTDFETVEEELPPLNDGEFLAKAEYLSVDPYMRAYMGRFPVGTTMIGFQVAKVLESRNSAFPVGSVIVGDFGWRTHTISDGTVKDGIPPYVLSDLGVIPNSYGVGSLGMPGNTAYFGFLELCQPKEGDTVVVTGAAGAVGSQVGQIAKIKGCKVIGFAGSDAKCTWLKKELGFDHAFNYKTVDPYKALKEAAPKGVDCYFDNVGGELSSVIVSQMNLFGRVAVCGAISSYNVDAIYEPNPKNVPKASILQLAVVINQLKIEGFNVLRWSIRWMEGIKQNLQWIQEGKIKVRETVTEGFDNTPQAFIEMLRGDSTGKAVIKV